ncbi:hypothetical protein chiPu_0016047 [Chiloscyllium punctatum]|uniref:Uncharacterized protein n=1 Tax=Chiloscyllium punctatum TaxID=137246 RepID=A0A401T4D9_CHIPU|nr:hypothetical protein [Chiloscyllium punctatum]
MHTALGPAGLAGATVTFPSPAPVAFHTQGKSRRFFNLTHPVTWTKEADLAILLRCIAERLAFTRRLPPHLPSGAQCEQEIEKCTRWWEGPSRVKDQQQDKERKRDQKGGKLKEGAENLAKDISVILPTSEGNLHCPTKVVPSGNLSTDHRFLLGVTFRWWSPQQTFFPGRQRLIVGQVLDLLPCSQDGSVNGRGGVQRSLDV